MLNITATLQRSATSYLGLPSVLSVNGETGTVVLDKTDIGLGSVLNLQQEPALGNPAVNGYVLSSTTGGTRSWVVQSGGDGGAFADLDFTGSNITSITTRLFSSLQSIPTTLAGYGIIDAQPLDSDLTAIAALATDAFGRGVLIKTSGAEIRTYIGAGTSSFDGVFASLTSKPTTLAGYGITDAEVPLTFSLPLLRTVNTISATDAGADGATKGVATFTAADFNAASGVVSIDYANGQAAASGVKGFLTAGDWATFDSKATSASVDSVSTALGDFAGDPTTQGDFGATNWKIELGLVIGTNVQAYDADLTTWAGITPGAGVATALAVATNAAGGFSPIDGTATLTNKTINLSSNTLTGTLAQFNTAVSDDNLAGLGAANTFTAANIISTSGAASTPAVKISGVPFAGTGTTSFPLFYINDANATASTTLNTAGTYLGVNGDGTQDLMNLLKDGTSMFSVSSTGLVISAGNLSAGSANTTLQSNGNLKLLSRGFIIPTSDGVWTITNNATAGWTRLNLGVATNSGSAIGFDAVNGFTLQSAAGTATWNDSSTAASGTVANRYLFGIAAPTLTATNATTVNTVASTVYIGGAPVTGDDLSITTAYALLIDSGRIGVGQTITTGGTTGAQTINKSAGTVNFATAASTLVVTNSLVTTNSTVYCSVRTNDATAVIKSVVPAAGSFTITLNAATTGETSVGFFVVN